MTVHKFNGHTTKQWIAYTKILDGSNLPTNVEGKTIKWQFSESIDTANLLTNFSKTWLKEIEEHGFYIPNPKIEWGQERTEKL